MRVKYLSTTSILISILAVSSLSISALTMADDVTVYRWVDENNVVHFSQHQPSHNNYTELSMSNVVRKKDDTPKNEKETIAEPLNLTPSKEKCEEAKANVRTLKAYDKIQFTDGQGKIQVLNAQEKLQQLAINEKQVEVYCAVQ